MTIFEERLKLYFQKNKQKMKEHEITICIGNEGMDLDSFVSSLIVGYAEDVIHVVNMRKEVFLSKGDLMYVLKLHKINPDDLIYLERPLAGLSPEEKEIGTYFLLGNEQIAMRQKKINMYLTDHNEPVRELQHCEVSMVIDHHRLESKVETAKRIYIDVDVGSATTLVAKYLGKDLSRKHHCINDPKNKDPEKDTLCVSIAKLLLIPIIIDTKHLKRRTSIFDYTEYKRLKKKANVKKKELKKLRKQIKKERLNDSKYDTEIILQKDFKQYYHNNIVFGISTVKYSFRDWVEREGKRFKDYNPDEIGAQLYLKLNSFRKKLGLDFLLVGYKEGETRHFVIINFPLVERFAQENKFVKDEYKSLEFFNAPVEVSRKIVAPKIRQFLNEITRQ